MAGKVHSVGGLSLTVREWAAILGVSRQRVHKLIQKNGSPIPPGRQPSPVFETADGRSKTVSEWATLLQLDRRTIKYRIAMKGDPCVPVKRGAPRKKRI